MPAHGEICRATFPNRPRSTATSSAGATTARLRASTRRYTAGGAPRADETKIRRRELDSRSVQAAGEANERGKDPNKKVVGRKQHLCVDTEGFLLSVAVTVASANDKAAAYELIERAAARSASLVKLWADGAYASGPLEAHAKALGVDFEVVTQAKGPFAAVPRRWVVERTFAWLKRCRRLVLDFERLASTVEAFIYVALTRLLLNRLAPRS